VPRLQPRDERAARSHSRRNWPSPAPGETADGMRNATEREATGLYPGQEQADEPDQHGDLTGGGTATGLGGVGNTTAGGGLGEDLGGGTTPEVASTTDTPP
jgi:hypothetical protein